MLALGCSPQPRDAAEDPGAREEIESGASYRRTGDRPYSALHRKWIESLPEASGPFPRLIGGIVLDLHVSSSSLPGTTLDLVLQIEDEARSHPGDPLALAAAASVALWSGQPDRALVRYRRALQLAPDDPRLHSDLAMAEMLSFDRSGDIEGSLDALESAARAVELAPEVAVSHCNLAWVLERHRLNGRARSSWRACRDRADSAWWPAIERSLSALDVVPVPERWAAAWTGLAEAVAVGDVEAVSRIVAIDRRLSREAAVLDLLGGWAEAHRSRDEERAAERLARARAVGAELARGGGDGTVRSAVEAIERSSGAGLDRLARGHLAFRRGFSFCRPSHDAMRARAPLEEAVDALEGAGSPVALWARTWVALGVADPDERISTLRDLLAPAEAGRTPALAGRVHWLTGLMLARRGDWIEALHHYRRGRAFYETAGETEWLAALTELIAEAEGSLGDERAAWTLRREVLDRLSGFPASRFLHNALWQSGDALVTSGRARAALVYYEEGREVADRVGDPLIGCEARFRRHHAYAALGDRDAALSSLDDSERWAERVESSDAREGLRIRIASARGEILRRTDPGAAINELETVIAFYAREEIEIELARVHLSRARAWRALGRSEQAEPDLRAAVASLDRQRRRIVEGGEGRDRVRDFLEVRQEVFDEWIGLLADDLDAPERAFEVAERSRYTGDGAPRSFAELADEIATLPTSVEIVELALVSGALHVWHLGKMRVEHTRRDVEGGLDEWIERYLSAVEAGDATEEERLAAELGERLLPERSSRDQTAGSPDHALLVVVPDRTLSRVPFHALRDPGTGRRLVEDRSVVIAPSLHTYLEARGRSRALGVTPPRQVLVVSDPAFERARYPDLQPLPAARKEGAEVAALYRLPRVLEGRAATPPAVLSALAGAEVLHYTGHAVGAPFDPAAARLVLAPYRSDDPSASGLLSAEDLRDTDVETLRLAVLSACSTAAAPGRRTAILSGIAGELLDAGVPALLGTAWPVPDGPSRLFQTLFHRRYRETGDPARALARTQRDFIHHQDPTLREPRVWAAYSIVGAELPQEE